jgi:hypothetical protein
MKGEMMKKYIFLAILLVITGGVYYFMTSFESIVKKVVHKYGSEVTGTDVNIDGLDISLKEGKATIKKITVANPKGYDSPYLFELAEISVKINLKSLTTDTIIIESVEVHKPVVTYEMKSLTQNNISQIQKNVSSYSSSSSSSSDTAKKEEAKKDDSASSKKVIINKIKIDQGQLNGVVNLEVPGIEKQSSNVSVKLPQIVITDLGKEGNGETIVGATTKILNKILTTASQTIVQSNLTDLKAVAQKNMDSVVGSVKDRVDEVGGIFKNNPLKALTD